MRKDRRSWFRWAVRTLLAGGAAPASEQVWAETVWAPGSLPQSVWAAGVWEGMT